MTATDLGTPAKSSSADVDIKVDRNLNGPQFVEKTYDATVDEKIRYGAIVINCLATDADSETQHSVCIFMSIVSSDRFPMRQ